MASFVLYPPVIDATAPAFVASGDSAYCRLYFSLSRFSSSTSAIKSVHISILKQSSGQSVVRKVDNDVAGRYRSSGIIIINAAPIRVEDENNLYYIDILNEDVFAGDKDGWNPGWIYKIQLRLSSVAYTNTVGQAAWLTANANNFSEWSTYCTTKAISQPKITIPILNNYDSSVESTSGNREKVFNISNTSLNFSGAYSNTDETETLYSYSIRCYDNGNNLLEDSGLLYPSQYQNTNQFNYLFKRELAFDKEYNLELEYTTLNQYIEKHIFTININRNNSDRINFSVITIDSIDNVENEEFVKEFTALTSKASESEDGRVGYKLYSPESVIDYNGNLCIRRASSKDNFSTWEDIKMIVCVKETINDLPMYFDNTIESGVFYKYGVEKVSTSGERGILNLNSTSVIRDFEYSILVGEDGKQLRLMYDNTMSSYTYTFAEGKVDPIGGKYPRITRNGDTKYRVFPVSGLISYNMDENGLFETDSSLYKYNDIADDYKEHRRQNNIWMYDYKKEFDFREAVLEFLQDGKPKLFKSPTEGNVIVRLMQVSAVPNQSLNRMIFSFTSTAYEFAEATLENYEKYKFFDRNLNNYSTSFVDSSTKIGQLSMDLNVGDNIISKIWEKYNHSTQNIAGKKITLKRLHHLTLEFTGLPLRVRTNTGEEVLGNNFSYGSNTITVRSNYGRLYQFDENVALTALDSLIVLDGLDESITTIPVMVNFLYDQEEEPYAEKQIDSKTFIKGVGQFFSSCQPNENIYKDIYYEYYYEWEYNFRRLTSISWTTIEAAPGAIFLIQDLADNSMTAESSMYHEMNKTGILNLENLNSLQGLKYIGMRNADGSIDKTKPCDVLVDYIYYTTEGTYKGE